MKKHEWSDEQLAEIKLRKQNLSPATLLAVYDSAMKSQCEREALGDCIKFNGNTVKIPLPSGLRKRVESLMPGKATRRGWQANRGTVLALAIEEGLSVLERKH